MKVIYAVLNSQVFHPTTGRLIGTLVGKLYPGIAMSLTGNGVKIVHKGCTLLVPLHKFEFVELEEKVDAKKPAK